MNVANRIARIFHPEGQLAKSIQTFTMLRPATLLISMLMLPLLGQAMELVETNSKEMAAKIAGEGAPNYLTPARWLPGEWECLAQFVSDESFSPTRALVLAKTDSG